MQSVLRSPQNIKSVKAKTFSRKGNNSKLIYSEINVQTTIKKAKSSKITQRRFASSRTFPCFYVDWFADRKKKQERKIVECCVCWGKWEKFSPNIYPTTIIENRRRIGSTPKPIKPLLNSVWKHIFVGVCFFFFFLFFFVSWGG